MTSAQVSTKLSHQPGQMGPITAAHPPWPLSQMIAYFKVRYSGTSPPYSFSYAVAGYFNQTLNIFLPRLLPSSTNPLGPPDTPIATYGPSNLDFDLGYACYVVFHLDPTQTWQYRYSADGIETNDTTPNEYLNLIHMDDQGGPIPGSGTVPNPSVPAPVPPVHVAYFAAKKGSAKGTLMPPSSALPDCFNLYVNIPSFGDCEIDPDIKNTGRPPGSSTL